MLNKKLLLVLVLGLVLRVVGLNQSLWLDEATSIKAATQFSYLGVITKFSPGDFHPPLYYLVLKAWISLFGSGEVAVRSLSVLLGVSTLPFIFLIGRRFFNPSVGLTTALLLATSGLHIYYSQEARMYVPTTFFATLVVWFFVRILRERKSKLFDWIGLVAVSALLVYTDYLPVFLLVALGLYLLFFERKHLLSNLKMWVFSGVAISLLFIPWLPVLVRQLNLGIGVKSSVPGWWQALGGSNLKQLMLVPVKFMIGRISFYDKNLYALVLVLSAILFGVGVFKAIREVGAVRNVRFILAWLVIPIFLAALLGLRLNVFIYFRLLFALPAFYLLVSFGVFNIQSKKLKSFLIILLVFINILTTFVYLFNPKFHREDWRGAVSWIEETAQEGAATIFVTKNQMDPYFYYSREVPAWGVEGIGDSLNKIYLMRYVQPIFDPEDNVRKKIESLGYTKKDEKDFNGVVVWKYVR